MTPVHHGQVKDGRVRWDDPARALQWVQSLEGKRVEVVIRREVKRKSSNQRSYFHWGIKRLADHCGNSQGYMKALIKLKVLWDGETVDEAGLPVVPSTEELSMEQYRDLIDRMIELAAHYGCIIPSPWEAEA